MGKVFSVESFAAMKNAADQLRNHATNYKKIAQALLFQGQTIASWGGADQEAFVQKVEGLTTRLELISAKLELAGNIIDEERSRYVGTQDAIIEGASKLQN